MIFVGLLGVIVVIALFCGYFGYKNQEEHTEEKSDAIKIQEEYASLNEQINERNKKTYPSVNLSDKNPFLYKSLDEVVSILEHGTGIIYFGFKSCPWCRSMLPILEEAASSKNIGEIYYLDIESIRDVLSLDENNKVITEKEGSPNYYKILELLQDYLSDYSLLGKDGKTRIATGEKRLYAPTVVAVQNGSVKGFHENTVKTQKDGYSPLKEEEKEELKGIYQKMMDSINFGVCSKDGC